LSRSELFKTQIKKETLETEIELLENQIKLKRKELGARNSHDESCDKTGHHNHHHNILTSASSYFADAGNANKQPVIGFKSCSFIGELPQPSKAPFSYEEVCTF
jgi:hypothetical protein